MFKAWGRQAFGNRYAEFESWLDGVLAGSRLPEEVVAVNFNIYDGAGDTYDIELIGAPHFDESDDDWACEELFASNLLSLPVTPETEDWEDGLSEIIGMVRGYLQNGQFRDTLESLEAVGVGHVSGAIEVVYRRSALLRQQFEGRLPDFPGLACPAAVPPETVEPTVLELFAAAEEVAPESFVSAPSFELAQTAPVPTKPVECFKLIRGIRSGYINCKPKREYGIRRYELMRAAPFARWNPEFTFLYRDEKGNVPTDLLSNTMGWLVVSAKLKGLLEGIEAGAEYFPVKVMEESSGEELPGYHVLNLLRRQDALSLADSEYEVVDNPVFGRYSAVKRYALRGDAVGGADIFKLGDHQEIPVFVTGHFKRVMEENGVTGMAYFPVIMV